MAKKQKGCKAEITINEFYHQCNCVKNHKGAHVTRVHLSDSCSGFAWKEGKRGPILEMGPRVANVVFEVICEPYLYNE